MSLDIWIETEYVNRIPAEPIALIRKDGRVVSADRQPDYIRVEDSINITHNVHPQIAAAGADPWGYEGRIVRETIPEIERALAFLSDPANESKLRSMDSPNGWGTLESSRSFMEDLLRLAQAAPDGRWKVSK